MASANPDFEKDDTVVGLLGWEEYSVVRSAFFLRKIDSTEFPLSYHAGLLGIPLSFSSIGLHDYIDMIVENFLRV